MIVLAIDPGPVESAWVLWDAQRVHDCGKGANAQLLHCLAEQRVVRPGDRVVIEEIESFWMAVGKTIFRTVFWAGKFAAIAEDRGCVVDAMPRRTVKLHLCGQSRAKDTNIRTALIDRFGG